MLFHFKQHLYLAIVLVFASISYVSAEDKLQTSIEPKNIVQIAREYWREGKHDKAIEMLQDSDENASNAEIQCLLGTIYGEKGDCKKAVYWLTKAASQGNADAQYFLGSLYLGESGIRKNRKKALFWLNKAAEQNKASAQFMIGLIHFKDKAYKQALPWFIKAANQNEVNAQYHIGIMYLAGLGISQDYSKSFSFLEKAAIQGDSLAQFELGIMFIKGEGVQKDYITAAKWIEKAAKQDHEKAQCCLGALYKDGLGVQKNVDKAIYWLTKALLNKSQYAGPILRDLYLKESLPMQVGEDGSISIGLDPMHQPNESKYSNEKETVVVDIVTLSSKEVESHADPEIRYYANLDPGTIALLYMKNFPINKKIICLLKRNIIKDQVYNKEGEFYINERGEIVAEIGCEGVHFICVGSRGFIPGERVSYCFTTEDGQFKKEISFIPNPMIAKNKSGTASIEAELITPFPAYYQFRFIGFEENEAIELQSISGQEKKEESFRLKEIVVWLSPDTINQQAGVGKVTFTRKTGEKFQLNLPWGMEIFNYVKGKKAYIAN